MYPLQDKMLTISNVMAFNADLSVKNANNFANYIAKLEALNTPNFSGRFILSSEGVIETIETYQKRKGLAADKIGKYFSLSESKFQGSFLLAEPLLLIADAYREALGSGVTINSAFRTEAKQVELKNQGFKTALFSPHCLGIAFDFNANSKSDVLQKANLLKTVSKKLKIPVRLGYNQYLAIGQTFVHCDIAPFYFGAGRMFELVGKEFIDWASPINW